MSDGETPRSRSLTIIGSLEALLGLWGFYSLLMVRWFFDRMVQGRGPGGPASDGPRPEIEPWALAYCAASAGLMLAAGVGLLRRRRWGPALAGLGGTAWIVGSFTLLRVEIRTLRGWSFSPPIVTYFHVARAGGALLALIFSFLCLSCGIRRAVRRECGAGSLTLIQVLGMVLVAVSSISVTAPWADWYWDAWGFAL